METAATRLPNPAVSTSTKSALSDFALIRWRVCTAEEMVRWLEQADPTRNERATPVLLVVNAIAWHLRVGGPRRALPGDFPAWRTVYGWFRRWLELGLFYRLLCDAARLRRRAVGRKPEPSLGIIDTQSFQVRPGAGPARL